MNPAKSFAAIDQVLLMLKFVVVACELKKKGLMGVVSLIRNSSSVGQYGQTRRRRKLSERHGLTIQKLALIHWNGYHPIWVIGGGIRMMASMPVR